MRSLLLEPLGPGGNSYYKTASFDLVRDEPIAQTAMRASRCAILIVDGTFLQRPELVDCWDLVVFADMMEELATQRGIMRDAAALGGEDRAAEAHRLRYQAAFALYEERVNPRGRAQLVFCNNDVLAPSVSG